VSAVEDLRHTLSLRRYGTVAYLSAKGPYLAAKIVIDIGSPVDPALAEPGTRVTITVHRPKCEAKQLNRMGNEILLCHWPGCERQVPPAMWGCKPHWFKLPKQLRDRIWATYEIGQEVSMTPSHAWRFTKHCVLYFLDWHGYRGDWGYW
jgi:hypothetical protein